MYNVQDYSVFFVFFFYNYAVCTAYVAEQLMSSLPPPQGIESLSQRSRGLYTPIRLYNNKGCNEQRSQATTSSISSFKKILKNHIQTICVVILIYLSDETSFFTTASL